MRDFREVGAWPKAHALVLRIYRETKALPREEMLGVTMLIRRSATAIATRIAEGSGREGEHRIRCRPPEGNIELQ